MLAEHAVSIVILGPLTCLRPVRQRIGHLYAYLEIEEVADAIAQDGRYKADGSISWPVLRVPCL